MARWFIVLATLLLLYGCATPKKDDKKKDADKPKDSQEQMLHKVTDLQHALEADPNAVEPHYKLGNVWYDMGRLPEAKAEYEKAVDLQPNYAAAQCNLGLTLRLMGDLEGAIKHYQAALATEPDDEITLRNLIAAERMTGKFDDAIVHLTKLAELKKDDVEVRSELANILFRGHKYEEAAKVFEEVIAIDPGHSDDYYNLGLCYFNMDKMDQAMTTWLATLAHNPNNEQARKGIAVVYWRRGEYDNAWKAVADCQKRGILLDPEFVADLRKDSGKSGPDL